MKALDFEGLNSFVTLEFKNTYHKELPSLKGTQGMTSHPSPLWTRRCRKLCYALSVLWVGPSMIHYFQVSQLRRLVREMWESYILRFLFSFLLFLYSLFYDVSDTFVPASGYFLIMKRTCLLAFQEFVKCEWSECDLFLLEEFSKGRYFVTLTWLPFANHLLIIADSWNKIRFNRIWYTPYF